MTEFLLGTRRMYCAFTLYNVHMFHICHVELWHMRLLTEDFCGFRINTVNLFLVLSIKSSTLVFFQSACIQILQLDWLVILPGTPVVYLFLLQILLFLYCSPLTFLCMEYDENVNEYTIIKGLNVHLIFIYMHSGCDNSTKNMHYVSYLQIDGWDGVALSMQKLKQSTV